MYDDAAKNYQERRVAHWEEVARRIHGKSAAVYYHRRLRQVYKFLVPPGLKVLELGCGDGNLLASLRPATGVGVDFSGEMVRLATRRHPELSFLQADVHDLPLSEQFDFIIISDLTNDLWDIETVFKQIKKVAAPRSRVIINAQSPLWELPLWMSKRIGLARPTLLQNWLTAEDLVGLLGLADFEVVRKWEEILCPVALPLLAPFLNRCIVKIWPFKKLALTNFIVARPLLPAPFRVEPMVSVVVPARNESGNIPQIFARLPRMGRETELIFVEGHSSDDTYSAIEREIDAHPEQKSLLLRQSGVGKGDAVRLGFTHAKGDILMILDADLTVPPECLPRFYDVLHQGKGEFANGVRLVYPMEKEAMRFLNLMGNKFFSRAFSWLLGQPIKDTLCGTKTLWKSDYDRIAANRSYFGDFDPFGDFDLLFGAAKLNIKIREVPIRYMERSYGATNIRRWRHGWLLLKMVLFAVRRIKFV
ncbi:MAG TPA: bifunctional class I SAM-dependent methyltransferase/glycosyltransferase family 2 protein [Syntrophales bacterium]|nr:bifunctional class I SAM-dependent methyltransferase/glycosyltransferase family 2 protein [Syntrophales bacterium]